jgi:ankyrin repeat protein
MSESDHSSLEEALVHEVWRQDLKAIERLLKSGANPDVPGGNWSSAIACAGENDTTGAIARLLVAFGANINLQDSQGLTPLHHAVDIAIDGAAQRNLDRIDWHVVGVFLDLGADPGIPDARGKTVFDLAKACGDYAHNSFIDFMTARGDGPTVADP